jgi:hypothetical protein
MACVPDCVPVVLMTVDKVYVSPVGVPAVVVTPEPPAVVDRVNVVDPLVAIM